MEKRLPIFDSPIKGYTFHSYPLSILLNHDDCFPWFYSNYIQLVCNPAFEHVFFDFCTLGSIVYDDLWIDSIYPGSPWINRNSIEPWMLMDCNIDIAELLTSAINHENYILTSIDQFLVPNSSNYQVNHYFHEVLIFGYNTDKKYFNILAYDSQGQFVQDQIDYDALRISMEHFMSKKYYMPEHTDTYYNPIKFLKINKSFSYQLDIKVLRDLLVDYLHSTNSYQTLAFMRNLNENFVYGTAVYQELETYFQRVMYDSLEPDLRVLRILLEHKQCMLMRINYLSKTYDSDELHEIYKDYSKIAENATLTHRLCIKYTLDHQKRNIEKIITMIRAIAAEERIILLRFIDLISALI